MVFRLSLSLSRPCLRANRGVGEESELVSATFLSPPSRSLLLSNRKALGGWGRGPTRTRPLVPGTVTGDVPSLSKLPVRPPRSRDAGQERPLVFLSENLTYPNSSAPPLQRRHEQHGTARRNKSRLLARLAGKAGSIYACAGIQARKRGRGSEAQEGSSK